MRAQNRTVWPRFRFEASVGGRRARPSRAGASPYGPLTGAGLPPEHARFYEPKAGKDRGASAPGATHLGREVSKRTHHGREERK